MIVSSGVVLYQEPKNLGFSSVYQDREHSGSGKKVKGWQWDNSLWKSSLTSNTHETAPFVFNQIPSGILTSDDYIHGIGSEDDLILHDTIRESVNSGVLLSWIPEVKHGWYYMGDKHIWMYSDDSERMYTTFSGIDKTHGHNLVTISGVPAGGFPISASKWKYSTSKGARTQDLIVNRVIDFTGLVSGKERLRTTNNDNTIIWGNVDKSFNEFRIEVVDSGIADVDPVYIAVFNNNYNTRVASGINVTTASDASKYLELAGVHTGEDLATFHTLYAPITSDLPVNVYTTLGTQIRSWPEVQKLSVGTSGVLVNRDAGDIIFGTSTEGSKPPAGSDVYIQYTHGVELEYEPETDTNTSVYRKGYNLRINPLERSNPTGFLLLRHGNPVPNSITLTALAGSLGSNKFGPIYAGNDSSILVATVYDENGQPIEDVEVTFNILNSRLVGSLGTGTNSTTALSDSDGIARTTYHTPSSIDDLGYLTTAVTSGIQSTVILNDNSIVTDPKQTYIYEVLVDDPVLGIGLPGSIYPTIEDYYSAFFTQQGITGVTATGVWESKHRLISSLILPRAYISGDSTLGRKRVLVEFDKTAINPHTANSGIITGAWTPLVPSGITQTSSTTTLTYNRGLPAITNPVNDNRAGYFIIAPVEVDIQARVYSSVLGRNIYSNIITLAVNLPNQMQGKFLADNLNKIPDALAAKFGANVSGVIPFGFRLRSDGVTLAGALDGATFLNIQEQVHSLGAVDNTPTYGTVSVLHNTTTATVNNIRQQNDTNYIVDLEFDWIPSKDADDKTGYTITGKTATGFTIQFNRTPPIPSGTINWSVIPAL